MAARESITLLHVSDMQFGRNHRFGNLASADPDAPLDTLFERLSMDLEVLEREGVTPELLVVSGDLVEWARKSEFEDALSFLTKLTDRLQLPRRQVVMVPGNHDINRKLSESYFLACEADDQQPTPPYAVKWKYYEWLFQEFYRDEADLTFTADRPFTYWQLPELHMVVAGINSTMAECHLPESHYGHAGEQQYRWFAARLAEAKGEGLFRLAVVHHNVQRGATGDDENLRDAEDLTRYLGASLNLLLHGHTHASKISWLSQTLPVLSTGSAALVRGALPAEVPNQYQAIRLARDRIERWTRRYDGDQKRWIGDTRCSDAGDRWHVMHDVMFADVHGALAAKPAAGVVSGTSAANLTTPPRRGRTTTSKPQEASSVQLQRLIQAVHVEIAPARVINYSMVQNGQGLFPVFRIRKDTRERLSGLRVEVVLQVGAETFPYKATMELDAAVTDLSSRVRLPLPVTVVQDIEEPVQASIYAEVTSHGTTLFCDTFPVTIVPINEWRDDDQGRMWLPSFVQPQDAAVGRVLAVAQSHLTVIRDDANAGFEGYQAIDDHAPDPTLDVDLQVRAIWAAISLSLAPRYINPPPTYTAQSQRLRTPSGVLDAGMGTDIDLALLLASCLEYVAIYPAIVLSPGHAFVAYWRSEEYHEAFMSRSPAVTDTTPLAAACAWCVGQDAYDHVASLVTDGRLVMLEVIELTQRGSFRNAVEEGARNLRRKQDFDLLIDIMHARWAGVTPLPSRKQSVSPRTEGGATGNRNRV